MTLSESDVLDMFSFLDNDDSRRDSAPMAQITESLDEGKQIHFLIIELILSSSFFRR